MARMLQALKNLEARSKRPELAGGLLAHLAERAAPTGIPEPPAPPASSTPATAAAQSFAAVANLLAAVETSESPAPARPLRRQPPLPVLLQAQTVVMESPLDYDIPSPEPVFVTEQLPEAPPTALLLDTGRRVAKRERFGASRAPTTLERAVRRTLSDPSRAQPLQQLAHRLAGDVEQTGSKVVLWIGVGESTGTHDTLLHAAALLAAEQPGQTLLVDADLARRPLSEELEYGQEPGLAELLKSEEPARSRCRPTAFENLSLLPAGLLRNADASAVGARLEELLKQLAADHSLVLINGGRSADLAATALARLADATYFVVQLGAVEASEAQAALRDFRAAGARVLGCVAT